MYNDVIWCGFPHVLRQGASEGSASSMPLDNVVDT